VARRYLARAATLQPDVDLASLIEVSTAYIDSEEGDLTGALDRLDDVLSRPSLSRRTKGVARSQRGLLHARSGNSSAALKDFTDALTVIGDDPVLAGRAYLNRGSLRMQNGDLSAARSDFSSVMECLGSPDVDINFDKARFNLGYAYQLGGELVEAMQIIDEVEPRLSELGAMYQATIQHTRGELLITAGRVSDGELELAGAARTYGRRRLRLFQGEAELIRARALLHHDPRQALIVARQAARRFRAQGGNVWALRAEAVALMAAVARGDSAANLVVETDALGAELRAEKLTNDATLVDLYGIRVLVRRGELVEARSRVARIRATPAWPINTRLMAHEVRADLARARGRRADAFRHVRAGLAELHAWQSSFGSLDLQSGVAGHGRQLAMDGLRMAVADGSPEVLLQWSERARALASRVIPVRPPSDERVSGELTELRWLQSLNPAPQSPEARRMTVLQESIRQHAWYGGGSGEVTEPCELAELQGALGSATALVAYVATEDELVALLVTDSDASVHRLGSRAPLDLLLGGLHADLDVAGADLPGAFAATVRAPLATRLGQLSSILGEPLVEQVGDRALVLTPSGVLAGVPWGLLPGFAGGRSAGNSMVFVSPFRQ
jgi:tetratricopeptide (TPR) repeat protein